MDVKWGKEVERIVELALEEDLGRGDVTTAALIPSDERGKGHILARSEGIVAGMGVAAMVFRKVDSTLKVEELTADGDRVSPGDILAAVDGLVVSILGAERTALNFLQRLSGIATGTAGYVEAVSKTKAIILDTRKTTPGLRTLEKYAVRVGGGQNHRQDLSDGILIKDNHLAVPGNQWMNVERVIRRVRGQVKGTRRIEIEVESIEQVEEAISAGADVILLDNMSIDEINEAVKLARGRALIEASGGINLDNVASVAKTGVDFISVGAITHSATALDISLELET